MGSATSSRFGSQPGVYWSASWADGGTSFSITGYNEQFEQWDGSWEYYQLTATFYVNISVGGYSGTATITASGRPASFSGTATINGVPASGSTITFTVTGTTSSSGKGTFYGTYNVSKPTYMTCKSSVTLGNTLELDFSNTTGITSYTHNLYFSVGSTNYTIANNVSLSKGPTGIYYYNWNTGNDTNLSSLMADSTELTITIYCATYKSGSLVGTSSAQTKVSAASYTIPVTISLSPYNTNTTVNGWGIYLKGYTHLRFTLTATSQSGTTITKYEMSDTAGHSYNSSTRPSNYTFTNVITSTGNITVSAKVTDSRGNTGTATASYTVYDYSAPYLQGVSVFRCNSSGTPANDGTYFHYEATAGISSCNGHNSISSLAVSYKLSSASTWTNVVSVTASSVSGNRSGISADSSYIVRFVITDALSSATYTKSIPTKGIPFNLGRGGTNAAFGAFATVSNSLEIGGGWVLILNDSIYGDTLPSSGSEGQIFFKTSS